LGIVIGGGAGWYLHELTKEDIRASERFGFYDRLADRQVPSLSVKGSWQGADLANKITRSTSPVMPSRRTASCIKPT
jgi:hypothetical protein